MFKEINIKAHKNQKFNTTKESYFITIIVNRVEFMLNKTPIQQEDTIINLHTPIKFIKLKLANKRKNRNVHTHIVTDFNRVLSTKTKMNKNIKDL